MSGEILRRAAADLRAKAKRADDLARDPAYGEVTGGPDAHWSPAFLEGAILGHPHVLDDDPRVREVVAAGADLLASWHPAVALAVADWLEYLADMHAEDTVSWEMACRLSGNAARADATARAYLGESA